MTKGITNIFGKLLKINDLIASLKKDFTSFLFLLVSDKKLSKQHKITITL